MKRIARYRPSGAMIVAIVALVVATAGTATAASLISGSRIRNRSIAGRKLKRGAVTTREVRNHSLLARDFRAGQLPRGPRGFTGATGPRGPAGPAGPAGQNGINGFGRIAYGQDVESLPTGTTPDNPVFADAQCPAGLVATGGDTVITDIDGSVVPDNPVAGLQVTSSFQSGVDLWSGSAFNTSGTDLFVVADVICANANQVGKRSRRSAKR
jgi:hypothetical protein